MEIADCKLRVGGDPMNVITKIDVTPAEVIILRHIHGVASVHDIQKKALNRNNKSIAKRSHAFELNRLRAFYNNAPGATPESEFQGGDLNNFDPSVFNIVNRLFPGVNPVLPITFASIEIKMVHDASTDENQGESDPTDEEREEAGLPSRAEEAAAAKKAKPASNKKGDDDDQDEPEPEAPVVPEENRTVRRRRSREAAAATVE